MEAVIMHRLMVVDDSNVIRRRIERAQDLAVEFVGAARNGREAMSRAEMKPMKLPTPLPPVALRQPSNPITRLAEICR